MHTKREPRQYLALWTKLMHFMSLTELTKGSKLMVCDLRSESSTEIVLISAMYRWPWPPDWSLLPQKFLMYARRSTIYLRKMTETMFRKILCCCSEALQRSPETDGKACQPAADWDILESARTTVLTVRTLHGIGIFHAVGYPSVSDQR